VFGVDAKTIRNWERQLKERGNLARKPLNRIHKKIDPEKLCEYLREKPDATQSELAALFGCSQPAVYKALKRHGYTRKKRG